MDKLRIFCVTNKEIKNLEKLNLSLAGVGKRRFKKKYSSFLFFKFMFVIFHQGKTLLGKYKKAKVSLPGGCAIGTRPVDLHLFALKKLGAKIY